MSLHDEILEQPAVASRFLETQAGAIDALAAALRERRDQIEHVVIAARGPSDHAAIYAQYVRGCGTGDGRPGDAVVVSLYGADPRLARWSWRSVSRVPAGIVAVVEAARRQALRPSHRQRDGSALAAAAG